MQQEQAMNDTTTQQAEPSPQNQRRIRNMQERIDHLELALEAVDKKYIKEKKLKDVYIERSKLQRRELEKLHYYDEDGTISNQKISQLVKTRMRHTNKRNIEEDYEELQVAHMIEQKELREKMQQDQEKCQTLEEKLNQTSASYENINCRYEAEVTALRQQADFISTELEKEKKSHDDSVREYQRVITELRAEKDASQLEMAQEYNVLQQQAFEKERELSKELEELKLEVGIQKLVQEEDEKVRAADNTSMERIAAELRREKEKNKLLQEEKESLTASYEELTLKYEAVMTTNQQQAEAIQSAEGQIQEYQQVISSMKTKQDALNMELRAVKESAVRVARDLGNQLSVQLTINRELMEKESKKRAADTRSCKEETKAEPSPQEKEEKTEAIPETTTIHVQEHTEEESEKSIPEEPSDEHQKDPEEQIVEKDESSVSDEAGAVGGLQSEEEEEAEVSGSNTNPSAWKCFRHAVGLRKPKRWKKKKEMVTSTPEPLPPDSYPPSPTD